MRAERARARRLRPTRRQAGRKDQSAAIATCMNRLMAQILAFYGRDGNAREGIPRFIDAFSSGLEEAVGR